MSSNDSARVHQTSITVDRPLFEEFAEIYVQVQYQQSGMRRNFRFANAVEAAMQCWLTHVGRPAMEAAQKESASRAKEKEGASTQPNSYEGSTRTSADGNQKEKSRGTLDTVTVNEHQLYQVVATAVTAALQALSSGGSFVDGHSISGSPDPELTATTSKTTRVRDQVARGGANILRAKSDVNRATGELHGTANTNRSRKSGVEPHATAKKLG